MIGIVYYGISNIQSIANGVVSAGGNVKIVTKPSEIKDCSALILPGVGAFPRAMENLTKLKLIEPIIESVKEGIPIMGICLGMHLLAECSEEFGSTKGLGLIEGNVIKIPKYKANRLPHMGWNEIKKTDKDDNLLLTDVPDGSCFYFVHSYMLKTKQDYLTSTTVHGINIPASLQTKNIFATQFHPEKSQSHGLQIMKNFVNISKKTKNGQINA
ncbi:imidazole glycerol phosphate synthase subunit HisH [Amylibacter sp.]|nr:imidazole glycerol phosphate synthase subunit HisH [Amylibacter sp.]